MSCVVGMLTLNGSVSIPACVNFGVASVAGGLEESAKKWAKVATEDAALYKAAVEPVGDWNQWQSAYNDRYRKAVEIVMLTTTGRLLLELCCASGDVTFSPVLLGRGSNREWPRTPFAQALSSDFAISVPATWGGLVKEGASFVDPKVRRFFAMLMDAAQARSERFALGLRPRILLHVPEEGSALSNGGADLPLSHAWKMRRAIVGLWQHGSDYDCWSPPEGWSRKEVRDRLNARLSKTNSPMVSMIGAVVTSGSGSNFGLQEYSKLTVGELKSAVNQVAYQLWQPGEAVNPVRAALASHIKLILDDGWISSPVITTIAHELVHIAHQLSPDTYTYLAETAFRCSYDVATRNRVNALYFGGGYSDSDEESSAVLEALEYGKVLKPGDRSLPPGRAGIGILEFANRVVESAAVFGCGSVCGIQSAPANASKVTSLCWNLSENSMRDELQLPKRGSYFGGWTSPWLGFPYWMWPGRESGCTGARYPWAPDGLAKLCGTENSYPWFQ